ncbi:MAG: hypothetical protein NT074_07745 [Methanomicrobiales archaeon]|nr:hypothetical protein [Methanomicrobiales archaeon]
MPREYSCWYPPYHSRRGDRDAPAHLTPWILLEKRCPTHDDICGEALVKSRLDGQVNSLLELFRMNEPTGLGDEEEPARACDTG